MKKLIIINGKGGVGKDTLIDFLVESNRYKIINLSSITPIKEVAKQLGWKGDKDNKSRKFLSDLKKISADYNNYPVAYICNEYYKITDDAIVFAHIREPEEIKKCIELLNDENICTLLIKRDGISDTTIGNSSDDNVENYDYDAIYDNKFGIEYARDNFIDFFERLLKEMERKYNE